MPAEMRWRLFQTAVDSEVLVALLEVLPGLFFILDEQGRYVFWNRNTEILLGYPPEELDGRPGIDLVAEEDRQRVMEAIGEVLRAGSGHVGRVSRSSRHRH